MKSLFRTSCLAAALVLAPLTSFATSILGGYVVVASDGDVVAKFLAGAGASYNNDLYLDVAGVGIIFNNHSSAIDQTVNLGHFTAGTELLFRLHVNTGAQEYDLFTGPADRNPDGIAHAIVNDSFSATETSVSFEDILGGGDRNFQDMVFSFTNVTASETVPDAGATASLLALGVASLFLGRRRFSA